MPFLAVRLKFFGVLTLAVFIVMAVGVVLGFVGPVQNNGKEKEREVSEKEKI